MPSSSSGRPAPVTPALHLRSEDMQDIIEQKPFWLARWGISLVAGFVLGMLVLGHFIEYPDHLVVPVTRWVFRPHSAVLATAETQVSQKLYAKLRRGQQVLLTFDRYPPSQYGYLTGTVGYLPDTLNAQGNFTVLISLPRGLETTRHETLAYSPGMSAEASIVITDAKLLDRVL